MTKLDEKLFKILKKTYYKKRYIKNEAGYQVEVETGDVYDTKTRTYQFSTDILSPTEILYLQQSGYMVNEITYDTHDHNVLQLKEVIKHPNLSLPNLLSAYVAGYGSFPRGRQPILSYLFARAVPKHSFSHGENASDSCQICAMKKEFWLQKGEEIFRNYWGYSWTEFPSTYFIDLAEFSRLPPITPTKEDIHIFLDVIEIIRQAPAGETPGKLEQRIIKSKKAPNCEKYRLRGQLLTLAELGVLPNFYIKPLFDGFTDIMTYCDICVNAPGSNRSDIILPLSGWRGEYGIKEDRFQELFGSFSER